MPSKFWWKIISNLKFHIQSRKLEVSIEYRHSQTCKDIKILLPVCPFLGSDQRMCFTKMRTDQDRKDSQTRKQFLQHSRTGMQLVQKATSPKLKGRRKASKGGSLGKQKELIAYVTMWKKHFTDLLECLRKFNSMYVELSK